MAPKKKTTTTTQKEISPSDVSSIADEDDVESKTVGGRRGRSASNVSVSSSHSQEETILSPKKRAKKSEPIVQENPLPTTYTYTDTNSNIIDMTVALHQEAKFFGIGRVSSLFAPTMQFTGHSGPIYTTSFDHTGKILASAGMDRNIFLWDVNGEKNNNFNVLRGHKNAVTQLTWLSGTGTSSATIASCSADKIVSTWDANKGQRIRKFQEHTGIVNCIACGGKAASNIILSGSDDCTGVLWDIRQQDPISSLFLDYQVTSVALAQDGMTAYTGGLDNIIRVWDLRNGEPEDPLLELSGHTDTVTGLSLSPDGCTLLSNSMDHSMRTWNIRPFVAGIPETSSLSVNDREQGQYRAERLYMGHTHGAEKALLRCSWSPDAMQVTCGSADRHVNIWDAQSCEPLYRLPGHTGSVNEVAFHPTEPVIASVSTDRTIWLGELS